MDHVSDEVLLDGFTCGDPDLTVAFVRRFQAKVYGVAFAVVGEPAAAEDVAQQAFERAWRHGRAFDRRRGTVATWLATVTRNLAIDTIRSRRPYPVDPGTLLTRLSSVDETPEQRAVLGESVLALRAELARLPVEQARAVVLASVVGLSASQVAATEGIPLGTAKTRIRSAMTRLRDALVPEAEDEGLR